MPRTFTLARLMLGITAFCILCGLLASRSETVVAYALTVLSLTPAAIVCLTLVSFSRRRKTVMTITFIGALIGQLFAGIDPPGPMTVWEAIEPVFIPIAISSTFGALVVGGIALAIEPLDARFPPGS